MKQFIKSFTTREIIVIALFVAGIIVTYVVFNHRISKVNTELNIFK